MLAFSWLKLFIRLGVSANQHRTFIGDDQLAGECCIIVLKLVQQLVCFALVEHQSPHKLWVHDVEY